MATHTISGNVAGGSTGDTVYLTQPTGNEGVQAQTVLDSSKNYSFAGLADVNAYIIYAGKAPLVKKEIFVNGSDVAGVNF